MTRPLAALCLAACLAAGAAPAALAAKAPDTWDNLVKVKAKRLDAAYLLPGADFRAYSKVILDKTEVAFRKNWVRDYNSSSIDLERRMSDKDAQEMLAKASTGFDEIFSKAYEAAGYQVVTEPGPDVLRLRTAVIDLSVDAPDRPTAGMSRTYSREAGEATLILEARDSLTGAILGRGVDRQIAGDMAPYWRSSVSNRGDFSEVFRAWAKASVEGLGKLKEMSPVAGSVETARR